ncbi:hypothetical protein [Archaeoglobus veneficus]|uniref:Rubredoxin-like domain-containing protein n=1 Tax=Archaeoglobus veneficus (strain DSM 11195 / SNP6) TaxID=693661 RepID=F2KR40_ARCVS|nr:hypothetical protein [Archaeoglobus veneficus]AEA46677.1 hypothetical protein Arcve_0657 [Archaeoglobus veneficus SNP6]
MTVYECLNCGHVWESNAKRPQCPKCKRYKVKEVEPEPAANDEPPQQNDEPADLTRDVAGEPILDSKPAPQPQPPQQQEPPKKSRLRRAVNILLVLGAVASLAYIAYLKLFARKVEPEQEKDEGQPGFHHFGDEYP